MVQFNLYYVPLATGIAFPVALMTCYLIGALKGHIRYLFSYISDGGAYAPESCIFSILLGFCAIGMAYTMWLRYKQIQEFYRDNEDETWNKRINFAGLLLGLAAGLGVAFVASFQENRVYAMHFFGAFLAFLGGGVYLGVQAYFTFKMLPLFGSRMIGWARSFGALLVVVLFVVCFGTGVKSLAVYTGGDGTNFKPGLGGWNLHIISVVTEWVMAAILDVYILSFIPEFKKMSREPARYRLVQVTTQTSNNNNGNKNGATNGNSKTIVMHRLEQRSETTIA